MNTPTAEAILAKGYDTDQTTHGTHVLGIAAGADNTDNKGLYGVATDADIALVSYNSKDMYTGDNTAIIDGVKYIFDYAQSVGKPCVVNLSLGSYWGPRDGSSTFDRLADELQGPGRLLVGSSGNSGGTKYHVSKTFEGNEPDTLATFFDFNYIDGQYGTVEVWGDAGMDITFVPITYNAGENKLQKVYEPARFSATQCDNKVYSFSYQDDGVWGSLGVEGEINPVNGKTHLILAPDFYSITEGYDRGFYIISSNPGTIHLWTDEFTTSLSSYDRPGFLDGKRPVVHGRAGRHRQTHHLGRGLCLSRPLHAIRHTLLFGRDVRRPGLLLEQGSHGRRSCETRHCRPRYLHHLVALELLHG